MTEPIDLRLWLSSTLIHGHPPRGVETGEEGWIDGQTVDMVAVCAVIARASADDPDPPTDAELAAVLTDEMEPVAEADITTAQRMLDRVAVELGY